MSCTVVDLYFYEELSRIAGHETGSQWLLSQTIKLSRATSRMSLSSTGCTSTPCRTPDHSAPASPRGQQMWTEAMVPAGHRNRIVSTNPPSCHKSFFLNIPTEGLDSPLEQVMRGNAFNLSPNSFKSDSSKIGLIFTDAAHSVLD